MPEPVFVGDFRLKKGGAAGDVRAKVGAAPEQRERSVEAVDLRRERRVGVAQGERHESAVGEVELLTQPGQQRAGALGRAGRAPPIVAAVAAHAQVGAVVGPLEPGAAAAVGEADKARVVDVQPVE